MAKRIAFDASLDKSKITMQVKRVSDICLADSDARRQFVDMYNTYGVVVIDCTEGADVCELRPIFGEEQWHELSDVDPEGKKRVMLDPLAPKASLNVEDGENEHQVHTDNSYMEKRSTALTLQCDIAATSGGESILVSSQAMHNAAKANLKKEDFEALFEPLIEVGRALPGSDRFDKAMLAVFSEWGDSGRADFRWRARDRYLRSMDDRVKPGYDFLTDFTNAEENRLLVPLKPGQCCVLDNTALCHGRTAFPKEERRRLWRVNYLDNGAMADQLIQGIVV